MTELSRRELLRRAAASGAALAVPGLLAACGGRGNKAATGTSSTTASSTLANTLRFSNWPLYIDVNSKTKRHTTLDQFTKKTGVQVAYYEDIIDNQSFFDRIERPLAHGQSIDRDIVVLTDSSGVPARLVELGWLEKLDRAAIPNLKNLVPKLAHPKWDPSREYSLPWQSGMTGIGYDPKKVGGELNSVSDLLTNPKLKGKITLLNELADTMGLVMLANGDDPSSVTDASFTRAERTIKKAVDSGQIRQFIGNDYAPLLARGDVWACFAWSGDLVQLQADHPELVWALPDTGGMIWTDNMLIPTGGNVRTASLYMNYYYSPAVAAAVEDSVNYICPVRGTREDLLERDPAVAGNRLIFPSPQMVAETHAFDAGAANNRRYRERFQRLIGA
jgi:spermidine/putrescine transport system substrate-binding protein